MVGMNKTFLLTLVIVLMGSVMMAPQMSAQTTEPPDRLRPPTLTVSGQAESSARPDQAILRLGTVAQAEQASAAQERVSAVMTQAIDAIKALGVKDESISTIGLSLHPVYAAHHPRPGEVQPVEPRIVGYRASNSIQVRLDDLNLVGTVVDAGVTAGANQIENLSFGLKDDTAARSAALRDASHRARAKADTIAEAMNVRIDSVLEINEGGVQVFPHRYEMAGRGVAAMDAGTPIQPGQVQVQALVTVTYRISQR